MKQLLEAEKIIGSKLTLKLIAMVKLFMMPMVMRFKLVDEQQIVLKKSMILELRMLEIL
jgi:hypothetical protein